MAPLLPLALGVALAAPAAPADTAADAPPALRTHPCPRLIAGAPRRYVALTGSGFTPRGVVAVGYAGVGHRARPDLLRADATGALASTVSGPGPRGLRHFITPVTLRATDATDHARTAFARFSVVRLGVRVPRVTRPHAVVTFRLYGFPDRSVVWAHYFFAGRPVATRRMGRTTGDCGLVRHRGRYLPARVRDGPWRLYLSLMRRFTRADARRRRYVLAGSFRVVERRYFERPRAAAAPAEIRWVAGALRFP